MKFTPKGPGRYPCEILLQSSHDIRVYNVECVVNVDGVEAQLDFVTPAYQAVTQDIPISNQTQQDWKVEAHLEGDGFFGPPLIYVQAGETTQYPLMFKPAFECTATGKLTLQNKTDGTEHVFGLKGVGKRPLALDHIKIGCQVRQITQKVLTIPNFTQARLTCKVASDLPMVVGDPTLTVKPGQSASYLLNLCPWKQGTYTGVISFVAEDGKQQPQHNNSEDEAYGKQAFQTLTAETLQTTDAPNAGMSRKKYTVWFSMEIHCFPALPEKTINVECAVQKSVAVEISITNPTYEILHLDVLLKGAGLTGDRSLSLKPKETLQYVAKYTPTITGKTNGSIVFQSDVLSEFWYELKLNAEKPAPLSLPEVQCELGKWTRQFIPLVNPTEETLELEAVNSNPENFSVVINPKMPLIVAPFSSTEVPVQFCPSALGGANHKATITFRCPQLNEWIFYLFGKGLIPKPMEPVSISTCVGSHSSVIVPFKNHTDKHICVDVLLTDQEQTMHRLSDSILRHSINKESAFCLLLKQKQGILLPPKEKLDIPVIFAPENMKLYEALLVVHVVMEDGTSWSCDNFDEQNSELSSISRADDGGIHGIRWIYPIHGIPEALPSKLEPAVISCQARNRVEERLEVLLTGAVPGSTAVPTVSTRVITTKNKRSGSCIQDEVQVTDGHSAAEEFHYEIQYKSAKVKAQVEPCLALSLVRKERGAHTGIVTLTFSVVYAPYKPVRHSVMLVVQCAMGGIWKFPIQLVATEPKVDDIINIEAAGLNKESVVAFRLTSQTRYPAPFTAYFLPGSDPKFSVAPQAGELLPSGTAGTLITVGFRPSMYSKKLKATLVIQTADMQWMYEIHGLLPQYTPPVDVSAKTCTRMYLQPATVRQRNFVRENLKPTTTAASSPIKGAPLVIRIK
nr:PREDICTED: cilia- and flagella-associated protein 47-like isoform X1 [Latimeria chalumnae]|eukprot:XP_014349939.1 PREDICTED: cilia- and flagella-associated protein 47-like isoform X1 [Latimeria chalumnae]